jgi:hypothetical protein
MQVVWTAMAHHVMCVAISCVPHAAGAVLSSQQHGQAPCKGFLEHAV